MKKGSIAKIGFEPTKGHFLMLKTSWSTLSHAALKSNEKKMTDVPVSTDIKISFLKPE